MMLGGHKHLVEGSDWLVASFQTVVRGLRRGRVKYVMFQF